MEREKYSARRLAREFHLRSSAHAKHFQLPRPPARAFSLSFTLRLLAHFRLSACEIVFVFFFLLCSEGALKSYFHKFSFSNLEKSLHVVAFSDCEVSGQ